MEWRCFPLVAFVEPGENRPELVVGRFPFQFEHFHLSFDAVGIGLIAAVAASILPWTRFGISSGLFGAWGIVQLRWSTLAAASAALGLTLWIAMRLTRRIEGRALIGLFVLSLASIAGTILHCYNPPPFTHAWLGPWVAIPSAALAACATTWTFLARTHSMPPAQVVP